MYREGNITLFEQGCCCLTEKMDYADGKLTMPQQKGFLYLCQDGEGRLLFDRTKARDVLMGQHPKKIKQI